MPDEERVARFCRSLFWAVYCSDTYVPSLKVILVRQQS